MGAKTSGTQTARPAGTCIPPLPPPGRAALANLCFHQTRNPLSPCPAPLNPSNTSPPCSPRLPPPQGPFTPRLHTGRLLQARVHGSNSRPGTDLSGALSVAAQVRTAGTQEGQTRIQLVALLNAKARAAHSTLASRPAAESRSPAAAPSTGSKEDFNPSWHMQKHHWMNGEAEISILELGRN
ncbi:unnamed protein product [Rangifer tarandus platyrhynchus]|uniref:Uncharacterized protein n=1 Tax=Rangifer tarandus platyrhynchus TaxID=3082113 RepID=A0AC59Y808_RANTA